MINRGLIAVPRTRGPGDEQNGGEGLNAWLQVEAFTTLTFQKRSTKVHSSSRHRTGVILDCTNSLTSHICSRSWPSDHHQSLHPLADPLCPFRVTLFLLTRLFVFFCGSTRRSVIVLCPIFDRQRHDTLTVYCRVFTFLQTSIEPRAVVGDRLNVFEGVFEVKNQEKRASKCRR